MAQQNITIDRLLNLVPDSPSTVLSHLASNPHLASAQDRHGYSLLHAATSYNHPDLLRALVQDYAASPNLRDEDGETPLFAAEDMAVARVLVEELGADADARNDDGQTVDEKLEAEDEWPQVAAYVREVTRRGAGAAASVVAQTGGANGAETSQAGTTADGVGHPPPVPQGLDFKVNVGTMDEPAEEAGAPDPEFRRRIEELAAREDFQTEEGQRELRALVQDALSGTGLGQGSAARRRVE
ncbi:hypothetical protein H2203_004230 [Taxawa tesnikishii (nom. ined.)]|nr:hypothetical protein H2203_004230 [Dothideales sp. JES 119]